MGCQQDYKEGYINVDIDPTIKADVYADLNITFPFPNDYADEILCENIFEHIPNPLNFLLEIKRVLKPKGKATIITDNSSYIIFHFPRWKGLHDTYNQTHSHDDQHYFLFQRGHLEAFTRKAGLKLIELDYSIMFWGWRNNLFQKVVGSILGHKFGYANFTWVVGK